MMVSTFMTSLVRAHARELHIHEIGGQLAVGVDHIHDLRRVVEAVPQVLPHRWRDQRALLPDQGAHRLTLGPHRAPEHQQVAPHPVNPLLARAGGLVEDPVLDRLEPVSQPLQHRAVPVEDRVGEGQRERDEAWTSRDPTEGYRW